MDSLSLTHTSYMDIVMSNQRDIVTYTGAIAWTEHGLEDIFLRSEEIE